jgi:hypothetical protein|tara:strand:- start:205 stop:417 length:213 start_codon:yes stop_codon:yes gene_type:complete
LFFFFIADNLSFAVHFLVEIKHFFILARLLLPTTGASDFIPAISDIDFTNILSGLLDFFQALLARHFFGY